MKTNPLGTSMMEFLDWVNWGGKTHPKYYKWHFLLGWDLTLNKKQKASWALASSLIPVYNVNTGLRLSPWHYSPELWAQISLSSLCFAFEVLSFNEAGNCTIQNLLYYPSRVPQTYQISFSTDHILALIAHSLNFHIIYIHRCECVMWLAYVYACAPCTHLVKSNLNIICLLP